MTMGLQYPSGVESESSRSSRLQHPANSDGYVGGENLKSKRSSFSMNWSDGTKVIIIRPPRPQSSSFPPPSPPPSVPTTPRAASMPTTPSSSYSRQTFKARREDASSRGTSGTSRLSSSTRAEVGQETSRPNMGGPVRAPSRHSSLALYPGSSKGSSNKRSSRHSHYTPSPRPCAQEGGTTTSQPNRQPTSSRLSSPNMVGPESVPIGIFNIRDYRSRDNNTPSLTSLESTTGVVGQQRTTPATRPRSRQTRAQSQRPGEQQMLYRDRQHSAGYEEAIRCGPAVIHVEANIREEGSRRSSRRSRAGERNDRVVDGGGSRFRDRDERFEKSRRGRGSGDFMRTLSRYLTCFSPRAPQNAGDADGYVCGPRSGSRNHRSGRR